MNVHSWTDSYLANFSASPVTYGLNPLGFQKRIGVAENANLHKNDFSIVFNNQIYTELNQFQIELIRKI
jgi:hypothetical protein